MRRVQLEGYTILTDRGFSGEDFETLVGSLGARLLRPDRRDEKPRLGNLGGVRQWVESIIDQVKDQVSLERHGAHATPGLITRIAQGLLALGAAIWFNWRTSQPGRSLTPTTTDPVQTESVI